MAVTVRSITDAGGFHAVEELQRAVWSMPDLEVVPLHQLRAAVSAGGVLLGAFDERGTLVGFCYGFIGLRDGDLLFYSHMAGVRLEVPTTFGDIKTRAPELALSWRMASREVFQHYFAIGYQAVDFASARDEAIGSYILRRTGTRPLARAPAPAVG